MQGLCAGGTRDELQRNVHLAIDSLLDLPMDGISRARRRELARVAQVATTQARRAAVDVARYALELRLVRGSATSFAVSSVGHVLMGLTESDAVAWILSLEVQQSLGPRDEWRMSVEVFDYVRLSPERTYDSHDVIDHDENGDPIFDDWPFSRESFLRLKELGVVDASYSREERWWSYRLRPVFKPLVESLAELQRTPLYVLAETLIADERDSLPSRVLPATQPHPSAAEIQARHARMVVHEIRNALVPVRVALSTLYESLNVVPSTEPLIRSRERIDRGIDRVFRFIDEMSRVAQLGVTAPSPFDVIGAINDAIKGLNGGLQLDVRLTAADDLAHVLGYRDRFTLAVVNLLRNAAQNSLKPRATVNLSAVLSASLDRVIVTLDDDGPGVPEASREDVFQLGFALRPGGSGQGLALVREVVEVEMKGQVRCEQSDLGGARFVLALPIAPREAP